MPTGQTAGDLIEAALRLGGAIEPTEAPTPEEINDGLDSLNDLLEIMSLANLLMYGTVTQTFPTVALQASYTVGPTGNWNTVRPVRINDSPFCSFSGVDYPIELIGQEDYDLLPIKNQQSDIVDRMLYVNDSPLGRVTLWPVPRSVINITFSADRVLTSIPNITTVMNYPPGYLLMMKNFLCKLLMPDYGRQVSDEVQSTAISSMAALKRANKKRRRMAVDPALLAPGVTDWQRGY